MANVTWERRSEAYKTIYEALGGTNSESINWERRSEALKAIHDAVGIRHFITLFGSCPSAGSGWSSLMFVDAWLQSIICQVNVPSGKTFKLWALGHIQTDDVSLQQLGARDDTRGVMIRLAAQGALYEDYSSPYMAEGPCIVSLGNQNNDTVEHVVSGFMVFSIE